jgi:hypothetical protein
LGSRGEVLVSDSSYAHHLMTPRALKDAKFSPGLNQHDSTPVFGTGGNVSARRAANSILSHSSRRSRYDGPREREWGTVDGDSSISVRMEDEDEYYEKQRALANRRGFTRGGLSVAEEALANVLAAQQAAAAAAAASIKPFDARAVKANAAPTVPRAADAALHQPKGRDIGRIFSQKLDLSHVQSKVQIPSASSTNNDKTSQPHISSSQSSSSSRSNDVFASLPTGRRRYDHIQPQVPTANSARDYKPSGGNNVLISSQSIQSLPWKDKKNEIVPNVPTAAAAATHKPRASNVSIFHEKVDFSEKASVRAVPSGALAKDAALYKPKGGGIDVFLWKKDPAARREPPPKKTEAQILEELFPGSQDPESLLMDSSSSTKYGSNAQTNAPVTRRRRGELAM